MRRTVAEARLPAGPEPMLHYTFTQELTLEESLKDFRDFVLEQSLIAGIPPEVAFNDARRA